MEIHDYYMAIGHGETLGDARDDADMDWSENSFEDVQIINAVPTVHFNDVTIHTEKRPRWTVMLAITYRYESTEAIRGNQ